MKQLIFVHFFPQYESKSDNKTKGIEVEAKIKKCIPGTHRNLGEIQETIQLLKQS